MKMPRTHKNLTDFVHICWLAILLAIGGCGRGETNAPEESNKLGALAVLYGRYIGSHGGRLPPNQEEFVRFIKISGEPILKQFGVSQAEELFTTSEGGQSIIVRYGATSVTDPNPIIAYESQTAGEKRKVLRSTGAVEELAEAGFQRLMPAAVSN